MPNLFAHHLLIKKLYSAKVTENSFMSGNFESLALGTQGPDPLFYEGVMPIRAVRPRLAKAKLGNKLHRSDGSRFMALLLEQIKSEPEAATDVFRTFVFGQFCHYILDKTCHPYIYYMSGFDEEGKLTGRYHYEHAHFESELDVCLALLNGMEDELKTPYVLFPDDTELLKTIEPGMLGAITEFFDRSLPEDYYENAVRNMRTMVKIVNKAPEAVMKVLGKSIFGGLRLPRTADRRVLNPDREKWLDPVTGEEHHESFQDLFDQALQTVEAAYDRVLAQGLTMETLRPYYDGLNYKGSTPGTIMKYKKN